MVKTSLKQRLLHAMGTDIRKVDLARAAGISRASVSAWFRDDAKDTALKHENVTAVARLLNVDPEWLATGRGPMRRIAYAQHRPMPPDAIADWDAASSLLPGTWVEVPRVELSVSPDGLVLAQETTLPRLVLPSEKVAAAGVRRQFIRELVVTTSAMSPYIECGDLALVDVEPKTVSDGKAYVLLWKGVLRIKRLYARLDGGLIVRADNPAVYPEETLTPEAAARVTVVGRIFWRCG